MSTSIAISSAALASSAAANSAASAAKKTACMSYIQNYKAETATVEEMREYASCVERLHPNELSDGGIIAVKVLIVAAIVGIFIGAYQARYERDYFDKFMFCFFGALFLPALIFLGAMLVLGVFFLLT